MVIHVDYKWTSYFSGSSVLRAAPPRVVAYTHIPISMTHADPASVEASQHATFLERRSHVDPWDWTGHNVLGRTILRNTGPLADLSSTPAFNGRNLTF